MHRGGQIDLRAIGWVASPLTDPRDAPRQGDEGAPDASIVLDPGFLEALRGLQPGDEILVLTRLDRADRRGLEVHPRRDPPRQRLGVLPARSPDRPNPAGRPRAGL